MSTRTHDLGNVNPFKDKRIEKAFRAYANAVENTESVKTLEDLYRSLFKCVRALKNLRIATGPSLSIDKCIAVHEDVIRKISEAQSWDEVETAINEITQCAVELDAGVLS